MLLTRLSITMSPINLPDLLQAEATERTVRGGMMAAGVSLYGVDNELGMSGGLRV